MRNSWSINVFFIHLYLWKTAGEWINSIIWFSEPFRLTFTFVGDFSEGLEKIRIFKKFQRFCRHNSTAVPAAQTNIIEWEVTIFWVIIFHFSFGSYICRELLLSSKFIFQPSLQMGSYQNYKKNKIDNAIFFKNPTNNFSCLITIYKNHTNFHVNIELF